MDADIEVFKACADPTRLRLLVLLGERELCVCELVELLQMPQGKISRHLAVLRHAGLVDDRRRGLWVHYSLRSASTPLARRLHAYLTAEAAATDTGRQDLQRLRELADCGQICARRDLEPAGTGVAVPA